MNEQTDGWTEGWTDGWTDGWMDGQTDRHTNSLTPCMGVCIFFFQLNLLPTYLLCMQGDKFWKLVAFLNPFRNLTINNYSSIETGLNLV